MVGLENVGVDLRADELLAVLEHLVIHVCQPQRVGTELESAVPVRIASVTLVKVRLLLTMPVASLGPPCCRHVVELDQCSRWRQSAAVVY
jgi:hypothetical protein